VAEKYWFKRRRYGYGWTPSSVEGWLVFAAVMLVTLGGAVVLGVLDSDGPTPVVIYLAAVALSIIGLLVATIRKGPKARWRWGAEPGDDPDEDF